MQAKQKVLDLALFGGPQTFDAPLHVGTPNFGDEQAFQGRFSRILASRRFSNDGPFVHELEGAVAALTGSPHAVAVCNATVGLQLLAHALELHGEIVMPSFTFIATAHAFAWVGRRPTFADIEPVFHGVSPASVEAAMSPASSAMVGVHTWGIECDVTALEEIAKRKGVPLILDAAHALGCTGPNGPIGTSGAAEVFSLHATKVVNSFEGGIITTRDDHLAARLRLLRDFGFANYDEVVMLGTNAKMSELHAIAGLTTLEALPDIVVQNRLNYERYRSAIADLRGLRLVDATSRGTSTCQYVVLEVDAEIAGVTRDALVRVLAAEGVRARRYFHPGCHRLEPYARERPRTELPITERISEQVLVLPTGPSLEHGTTQVVADLIAFVLAHEGEFNQTDAAHVGNT